MKPLSVFEQSNFIDDSRVIKEFLHSTDVEEVKIITDILHHSGTDPQARKEIEVEQEAWRTVNAMIENEKKAFQKMLNERDQMLNEKDQLIAELKRKLADK